MEEWIKIKAAADDPYAYAHALKQNRKKPLVGYFCSYAPEELIHAAGAVPFRIFGTRQNISLADAHLQSYCCSLVRGGLEDALKGSCLFLTARSFPILAILSRGFRISGGLMPDLNSIWMWFCRSSWIGKVPEPI